MSALGAIVQTETEHFISEQGPVLIQVFPVLKNISLCPHPQKIPKPKAKTWTELFLWLITQSAALADADVLLCSKQAVTET